MSVSHRFGKIFIPLICVFFFSAIAFGTEVNNASPSAPAVTVEKQKLSGFMQWCSEHPKLVDDVIIPICGLGWLAILIVMLYDPTKKKRENKD